ncbi:hypothetical protein HS088_TW04G00631 [Tripterygium wilfordii]|uniref:Hydroxyproline-rich glycoprotein family protein n=1 Tax=Tripterygium wilfordii TaxID=458696 RepID=A0A7J7DQV5_TRIWF|nr:uncharacterized protein At2g33490-like [Tripterygium wilfordii]KAF5748673.1 hypothetical protein HS088_TW04G00631 [Tripterygium wilfordii]
MKSPLGKLRKFALHDKNDANDKRDFSPSAQIDELARAAQDMQEMRDCYDSLLSAAAAIANSAYEFSESLREMGSCLLEKTAPHEDEESYKLLSMLGKTQFELQKLVDSYRSHIFMTITNPSESILNELRTVEDMKRQCDEKRTVYEHMMAQPKEKGRSKSGKGESFTRQQLQTAHDEYDEEATLCVFRLKSLKQGQSRCLLTQAARHHYAQLNFFRKGLKSLEAVDPHVRLVTQEQHIDYPLSGLEDDVGEDGGTDFANSYNTNEDGELSFDFRANKRGLDVVSSLKNSMEVDVVDSSFPQDSLAEYAEVNIDKSQGDHMAIGRERRVGSHSAPIFQERKSELLEKMRQIPSSTRKSNSYVLPTPLDAKGVIPSRKSNAIPQAKPANTSGRAYNLWHSSPLEQRKHEKDFNDGHLSELTALKKNLAQKESNTNIASQLPLPSKEGTSIPQLDTCNLSDTKKIKREAFSGPLASKPSFTRVFSELPQLVSGVASRVPVSQSSSSPKISPSASPPPASPRINELHELPRPPGNFGSKAARSQGFVGHSAPLASRNSEVSVSNKSLSATSNAASPLPTPPLTASRSFSVRSSNQRAMAIHVSKQLEPPQVADKAEEFDSPPLTPISRSLTSIKPVSTVTELVSQSGQSRGGADG